MREEREPDSVSQLVCVFSLTFLTLLARPVCLQSFFVFVSAEFVSTHQSQIQLKKKKVVFALKFILDLDCQPMYKYTSLGTHIMRPGLADGVRGRRLKTSVFGHLSFFCASLPRASEGVCSESPCPATAHRCPWCPGPGDPLLGPRPVRMPGGTPTPAPPREVPSTVCFPHRALFWGSAWPALDKQNTCSPNRFLLVVLDPRHVHRGSLTP